jgi:hypothetical protein
MGAVGGVCSVIQGPCLMILNFISGNGMLTIQPPLPLLAKLGRDGWDYNS